jgi:S1-C subfamily serine protease
MSCTLTRAWMSIASAVLVGAFGLTLAALAGSATASRGNVTVNVASGVVDINTNLRYENAAAAGTGIVLTSSGEVLTNNHVIRGATTIRVTDVGNGRTYPASVVGYNVAADIAVLKLKGASALTTAAIGDSASVKVGETITALGNAGGSGGVPSSATGRVVALGQTITASDGQGDAEQLKGLIEIDAALQPGDSGGPLVDSNGRIIGMNTAASSGYEFSFQQGSNSGYAIPINRAIALVKQIDAGHSSATTHIGQTALLGVSIQPNGYADYYGDSAPSPGALVANVLQGSPAARAGLTFGDVITSLDGRSIATPTTLTDLLIDRSPNNSVHLAWVDQLGHTHKASVKLAVGPPQ